MILSTHAQRLDRWLGPATTERLSVSMKDWYGPPIAVAGVPGNVWAHAGGDFHGRIKSGQFLSAYEFGLMRLNRIIRNTHRRQASTVNAGFTSLSDLIAEATAGKRREFPFQKAGPTGVTNRFFTLWRVGTSPEAGSASSAAAAGRALTSAAVGAFPFTDPGGGDTQHFVSAMPTASVAANTLLLYDRLFDVLKTMASTATESVTGVPTRYQSFTATDPDYAGGNFIFPEVGGTALAGTAHNWTVVKYRNQAGTDSQTMPSVAGVSAAIVDSLDLPVGTWFCPLASGDTGAADLDQLQCSASVATGIINFVIGHPLAWMPCPIANVACVVDGINTAFNLVRIFNGAALALLEGPKPSTTATTYTGSFITVAG